ncbi:MAG TPA: methyltransferase [Erysipelothrix sp.]|nr:methyltransferase [Erysipelothrix sp.]
MAVEYSFISDDGVFSKDKLDTGTRILLETISKLKLTGKILDYGSGIGVIGILTKKMFEETSVSGFDINSRAVELSKLNAIKQNVDVDFRQGEKIQSGLYDVILMNPPIRTGKQNIYSMFKDSYDHLKETGQLIIVIRKSHGANSAIKELQTYFSEVEIINRDKGFFIIRSNR